MTTVFGGHFLHGSTPSPAAAKRHACTAGVLRHSDCADSGAFGGSGDGGGDGGRLGGAGGGEVGGGGDGAASVATYTDASSASAAVEML